jgi:hypothetical protein
MYNPHDMRAIIISDITETTDNVIPYGLNVGKYAETKVDVLHLIDPQLHESPLSSYSDSQTFSPSEKLNHVQILEREKVSAEIEIDKVLSREGSRLNYPLRIEHRIEVTDVEDTLDEILKSHENPLMITASTPSRSSVKELSELLVIGRRNSIPVLVVPAGKRFLKPDNAIMLTTLKEDDADAQRRVFQWLKPFKLVVDVFASGEQPADAHAENWKDEIYPDDPLLINRVEVINGNTDQEMLKDLIDEHNPDMVVIPMNNKDVFGNYYLEGQRAKNLVESTKKPVLFY